MHHEKRHDLQIRNRNGTVLLPQNRSPVRWHRCMTNMRDHVVPVANCSTPENPEQRTPFYRRVPNRGNMLGGRVDERPTIATTSAAHCIARTAADRPITLPTKDAAHLFGEAGPCRLADSNQSARPSGFSSNLAVQAVPRQKSVCTASGSKARRSCPNTQWNTRPLP